MSGGFGVWVAYYKVKPSASCWEGWHVVSGLPGLKLALA